MRSSRPWLLCLLLAVGMSVDLAAAATSNTTLVNKFRPQEQQPAASAAKPGPVVGPAPASALLPPAGSTAGGVHSTPQPSSNTAAKDSISTNSSQQPAQPAAAKAAAAAKGSSMSACATRCFGAAEALGWATVANDALACYTPYNTTHTTKQLSSYDCCDVAERLLGSYEQSPLQECLCCPEFASAFLGKSVPYQRLNITAEKYATKLALCRVPIVGMTGLGQCSSGSILAAGANSTSSTSSSMLFRSGVAASSSNSSIVKAQQGAVDELDPSLPLTGGGASRSGGSYQPTPFFLVAGASRIYDAALTGFVRWIEDNVPPYPLPMAPQLPPLDPKYAADLTYVANLRRGAYPDLIKHRPPRYSMAATDPLQNGAVDTLPPTREYSGPPDSTP